ncbi:MBL fold metallo-hydrolase [Clostridium sp. 'White wine YQ']|uniref:MBL fold metallo-hydrolase n=1 Tax=Clostridium sp. 'White wine YQ' TaxID=3027474 RepID=UPI00236619C9|nr:MBL fold metallo-hydrolase [Clostridium sp. 'White wine YQ']MDD7793348.1 MBL fold metallo-hydrolase [Clostridium sp. 'White wine YQ']
MIDQMIEKISDIMQTYEQLTDDIILLRFTIVNSCIVADLSKKPNEFVLVDTGLKTSGDFIIDTIEKLYGVKSYPKAIILTHGHFDHVGSVIQLIKTYNIPVYVHPLEIPYLTGKKDYPRGDSTVDDGMVAKMSKYFPNEALDLGGFIHKLPEDGTIPHMPGWKWILTQGHTPGHISLYRESDGTIIVGDALCTTKQESLISVLTQREQISGPPAYLTTNWEDAKDAVETIANLKPNLAVFSHGNPLEGEELKSHLNYLKDNFEELAKPEHGRFT